MNTENFKNTCVGDSPQLRSSSTKQSSSATPVPEALVGKYVDTDPIAILKAGVEPLGITSLGGYRRIC
jgi:hypothetical protein